jgi:hypothetical protein
MYAAAAYRFSTVNTFVLMLVKKVWYTAVAPELDAAAAAVTISVEIVVCALLLESMKGVVVDEYGLGSYGFRAVTNTAINGDSANVTVHTPVGTAGTE